MSHNWEGFFYYDTGDAEGRYLPKWENPCNQDADPIDWLNGFMYYDTENASEIEGESKINKYRPKLLADIGDCPGPHWGHSILYETGAEPLIEKHYRPVLRFEAYDTEDEFIEGCCGSGVFYPCDCDDMFLPDERPAIIFVTFNGIIACPTTPAPPSPPNGIMFALENPNEIACDIWGGSMNYGGYEWGVELLLYDYTTELYLSMKYIDPVTGIITIFAYFTYTSYVVICDKGPFDNLITLGMCGRIEAGEVTKGYGGSATKLTW